MAAQDAPTHKLLKEKALKKFTKAQIKKIQRSGQFDRVRDIYDMSKSDVTAQFEDDVEFLVDLIDDVLVDHWEIKQWNSDGLNLNNIMDFLLYDDRADAYRTAAGSIGAKLVEYETTNYSSKHIDWPIHDIFSYPKRMGPDYAKQAEVITDAFDKAMEQHNTLWQYGTVCIWMASAQDYQDFAATYPELMAQDGNGQYLYYTGSVADNRYGNGGYQIGFDFSKTNTENSGGGTTFISKKALYSVVTERLMHNAMMHSFYDQFKILIPQNVEDATIDNSRN